MKRILFIIGFTLLVLFAAGLFSCSTEKRASPPIPMKHPRNGRVVAYILPFKVYRIEITETGKIWYWVWRYRARGKIPSTCLDNTVPIRVGDDIMIDTRTLDIHY